MQQQPTAISCLPAQSAEDCVTPIRRPSVASTASCPVGGEYTPGPAPSSTTASVHSTPDLRPRQPDVPSSALCVPEDCCCHRPADCTICHKPSNDPQVLPCGHVACQRCLEGHYSDALTLSDDPERFHNVLRCNLCQGTFQYPSLVKPTGVELLPCGHIVSQEYLHAAYDYELTMSPDPDTFEDVIHCPTCQGSFQFSGLW